MHLEKGEFEIDDDPSRLDFDYLVRAVQGVYWGEGLSPDKITASFRQSETYGLYRKSGGQVGCARVVTDYARFAWLSDVIVAEACRGIGLGSWLTETILEHPKYKRVDRWLLATRDAVELYSKFGFWPADPKRIMVMTR